MQRTTLIALLTILLATTTAASAPTGVAPADSLFALIPTLNGEDKLTTYVALHNQYFTINDLEGHLAMLEQFIADAEKEGIPRYINYSHSCVLSVLTNYGENKRFEEALPGKLKIFEKNEAWYYYFFAVESYTAKLIFQKRYTETIDYANHVLVYSQERQLDEGIGMANHIIGNVYTLMGRYDKAEQPLLASIEAYKRMPENNYNIATAYLRYVGLLYHTQRFDEMKKWLDEWSAYLHNSETSGEYDYFPLYINYTDYHLATGNTTGAEQYIDRVQGLSQVIATRLGKLQYYNKKAAVRRMQKRYPESLALIDSLQHSCQSVDDHLGVAEALRHRAEISAEAGLHHQAYTALLDFIAANDTIQRLEINKQLDELRTQYEVDRHIEARRTSQAYAILATIAALLLALTFTIYIIYSRREAARVRSLMAATSRSEASMRGVTYPDEVSMRGMTHPGEVWLTPTVGSMRDAASLSSFGGGARLRAEEDGIAAETDSVLPRPQAGTPSEGGHDAEPSLYHRLLTLMSTRALYTNPALTRREVAAELGTNENYLYKAIKENTGLTFQEYLYYLRLEHARRLLETPGNQDTIGTIAEESGYHSRKTFHQHFRGRYGCTPDEYRSQQAQF